MMLWTMCFLAFGLPDGAAAPAAAELSAPDEAAPPVPEAEGPVDEPAPVLAPVGATPLEAGLFYLAELELERALSALNAATQQGPYDHDQLIALYTALGTVRAFFDDEKGAKAAFRFLLTIAPNASLSYKTSTKATFLFEAVREEMRATRPPEVTLVPPVLVAFDQPVVLTLMRRHDPDGLLQDIVVRYRVQGADDDRFASIRLAAPDDGARTEVALPAVGPAEANVEEGGLSGAVVEVAVSAYDRRGWEVKRAPGPDRPLEIPVGFDAPGPWYTSWWAITGAMVGVAVFVAASTAGLAAGGAGYWVATRPDPLVDIIVEGP